MIFGSSEHVEKTLDVETQLDLTGAQITPQVSAIEYDDAHKTFWATIDRVLFKRPMEVVQTVLETQGYVVNLENVLACLDRFCFGVRAKVQISKTSAEQKVKQYTPAVTFAMPNKTAVGPLLQMFYDEVAAYEAELAKLKFQQLADKDHADHEKSDDELRKEISSLRIMNNELITRIAELSAKLDMARKSLNQQQDQYAEDQILPDSLRLAKVIGVYLEERSVALRSGKSTFHYPMALTDVLPQRGESCIVAMTNGIVKGAFFYESLSHPLETRLAKVLFANEEGCKMRDRERFQWVLRPRNVTEQETIRSLRRGNEVMMYLWENQIIKIQPVVKIDDQKFANAVQDSIVMQQLVQIATKVEIGDEDEMREAS